MAIELVEGWTSRISYTLLADTVAVNLTGMAVVMLLYKNNKQVSNYSGTSGIATAATGIVFFDPSSGDLVAASSPYSTRWKVTDGSGKITYFPNGEAEEWVVRKP